MFLGSSFGPALPFPRAATVRDLPCAAVSARGAAAAPIPAAPASFKKFLRVWPIFGPPCRKGRASYLRLAKRTYPPIPARSRGTVFLIAAEGVRQHEAVENPLTACHGAARALSIAVLVLAARAGAQPSGSISGVVLDATTQAPLSGALITARGAALLGEQIAVTDEAGAFEMTMFPPGAYALAVGHDGFLPFSAEGVVVKGRRIKVRLLLMPEPRPAPPPPAHVAVDFDEATMS